MFTELKPAALVSEMAENLIGSEIIKLAGEIHERIKKGERIFNFTIGDFDPAIFPIPKKFNDAIVDAYKAGHTNYPPANGLLELRQTVSKFISHYQQLDYSPDQFLIAGGARPLIYSIYKTLLDPGDKVVFPTPSWNNNHYCHLSSAQAVMVEAKPENNFMPTAAELASEIKDATILALCSPLNPTGTVFTKQGLEEICDLVIAENKTREGRKPLYILYDQIYWTLTFGETKHYNPVSLRPELKNYTIFVDGLSKSLAATGIRVGWSFGPSGIIDKMKTILGHVGAWAPKAEQVASARFMHDFNAVDEFLSGFKHQVQSRLFGFYKAFKEMKEMGLPIDAITPQAAIYLTVKIDLKGKRTPEGQIIENNKQAAAYLLNAAKLALVPFYAFGSSLDSPWYRLSVGTCKLDEIEESTELLKAALIQLK